MLHSLISLQLNNQNSVLQNHVFSPAVFGPFCVFWVVVDGEVWWLWYVRFSASCMGKALETLLHCVTSLSSSVLCKEREVNPMRLTNPCQGPALSRTQGSASQGLTPSTAVAACQVCSGCRWGRRFTGNKARVCLEHRVPLWRHGCISLNAAPITPPHHPPESAVWIHKVCIRDVNIETSLTRGRYTVTVWEGILIRTPDPSVLTSTLTAFICLRNAECTKALMVKL